MAAFDVEHLADWLGSGSLSGCGAMDEKIFNVRGYIIRARGKPSSGYAWATIRGDDPTWSKCSPEF
jgi:hypothetical protein